MERKARGDGRELDLNTKDRRRTTTHEEFRESK